METKLQPIADNAVASFVEVVRQDKDGTVLPTLLDVVEAICKFVATLGLAMIQAYVEERSRQVKANHRICGCGRAMQWHANSQWKHGTQFGNVLVQDCYAYCRVCKTSARPLHGFLGTDSERWSLLLEEKMVDLASDESCGKAVAKFARQHNGVSVGRTTALRMLHAHGENACSFVAEKLAAAVAEMNKEGPKPEGASELEVEYDCGMIPVATLEPLETPEGQEPERTPVRNLEKRRKVCRWEEAKLGLVQVPGEVEGRLYAVRPTLELDQVFEDLLAIAHMKGWRETTQVRGIADGAIYIRPRMAEAFNACPFRFILDRPHAKEHLSTAGEELEKRGGKEKSLWAADALDLLESGHAEKVVEDLRTASLQSDPINDTLRLAADYFERNQDAVDYAYYRQQGWSTASSEIESGHRSVVQVRLKLPGTWWHPDNVKNVLALRMIKVNGWWDEYWKKQRQNWRQRADDFRTTQPRTKLAQAA